jgi:hypothetical protein
MEIKIKMSFDTPSYKDMREASSSQRAQNAIAAWDRGDYASAMAWAGHRKAEWLKIYHKCIFTKWTEYPQYGGSPKPIVRTGQLTGSIPACALKEHILLLTRDVSL